MDKPLFSYINWGLVVCIILLFGVGELNLYSASGARMGSGVTLSDFYQRQFIWGLCGLGCMLLTMSTILPNSFQPSGSPLRERSRALSRKTEILASSEGCRLMKPREIQRLAP